MSRNIIRLLIILNTVFCFSQNSNSQPNKKLLLSEFFELIKKEKDSVFELKNVTIVYDYEDYQINKTISNDTIKKELKLYNVNFSNETIRNKIFLKPVSLFNCTELHLTNNTFINELYIDISKFNFNIHILNDFFDFYTIRLNRNNFYSNVDIYIDENIKKSGVKIENCLFDAKYSDDRYNQFSINSKTGWLNLNNNQFNGEEEQTAITTSEGVESSIFKNNFYKTFPIFDGKGSYWFDENNFPTFFHLKINNKSRYKWDTLKDKHFYFDDKDIMTLLFHESREKAKANAIYKTSSNKDTYNAYIENLSKLYDLYKSKRNTEDANGVYIAIKDQETARYKYLYQENNTFKNFFKWQINRFIGYFSDYGTDPSKAILISIYVILIFAFIYFFFPNNWDSNGKNRMMRRYKFFLEYLNIDSGMHEIYIKDQSQKMLEFEEFKSIIDNSKHKVPKFFKATAIPLYQWAISGTKTTSLILSKLDIMKGTWEDVPSKSKWWKGSLLILTFITALLFDILVKLLNALMLSINTFSTLGFGDIPIKGIPRYLAIIEGFIGWFMLTIFSVSLISQLLN